MNWSKLVKSKIVTLEAEKNYKHIAFVLRGGKILAVGLNHTRHAEVAALLALYASERSGVKVVSLRVRKDGSFAMAKPCKACEAWMRYWGVKKVTYTDSNGRFVTERY